eukprot:TRINITY_DN21914_c0_g1_i4.p1 TRINITY_DN21914_c0_g1~~TRINITY_DN21914_c0_g1_i4.p1  ORF type:complete len:121 (+),score=20.41 TRINITY_DN21914_c0_g1_i4:490-852(+)
MDMLLKPVYSQERKLLFGFSAHNNSLLSVDLNTGVARTVNRTAAAISGNLLDCATVQTRSYYDIFDQPDSAVVRGNSRSLVVSTADTGCASGMLWELDLDSGAILSSQRLAAPVRFLHFA